MLMCMVLSDRYRITKENFQYQGVYICDWRFGPNLLSKVTVKHKKMNISVYGILES